MSAIDLLFADLRRQGRKAFMPFVTAGDPNLHFTQEILRQLAACGSTLCEVGIPYSDPIADGPVIQASYTRALDKGVKLSSIWQSLGEIAPQLGMPIVSMASYAIIYRHGLENFVRQAQQAGLAGAIVPDLLTEEAGELVRIARDHDFSLIQLVTPTTPRARALEIAATSTGFLYYVSVTGITGERTELPPELLESVSWLREQTPLPICIGFGISRPEQVRMLAPVADGLIVGSAIVKRIAEAESRDPRQVIQEVGEYARELIAALNPDVSSLS